MDGSDEGDRISVFVGSDSEGQREGGREAKWGSERERGGLCWLIDGLWQRQRQRQTRTCRVFASRLGSGCLTRQRCRRMGKGMDCVWFERA